MDAPRTVQHPADTERFFTEGSSAWPPEPTADIPAVGAVPLSHLPSVLRGPDKIPGQVPETLRRELAREERDRLMGQLLFASRSLAMHAIQDIPFGEIRGFRCRECFSAVLGESELRHQRNCRVARVIQVLDELASAHLADEEKVLSIVRGGGL